MRARLLTVLALGALLVALPAVALGGSARHAANSTTYPDSTGEDPAAPDITSITVSNDDAGNITFTVAVSNRPALTPDMYFLIFIDTDHNPATGDAASLGAEYVIELEPGAVNLFQWNGSDFVRASSQASLTYSYLSTGPVIRISAADLGKTSMFNFGTVAASGFAIDPTGNPDFTNVHRDFAPDSGHGFYSYQVLTKLILTATSFTTAPKPAKAGRPFAASLAANENDTGDPVTAGTVTCAATINFQRIVAVTHIVTNGVANCVWRLPATAKGKTLRGKITLVVRGASVTRTFSARVT
jgi:hypothetical protein